ncbi:MAG: helix-turn-helix domain-containing protein [Proteobacteria bacterium]|nr:helix-turn-helix domain-containing protein [Pseudomonadota bacterium]
MMKALSIRQVAEYFKVSTRTIREWVKRDDSFPRPFKKFGTLRFRHSEIEKYWASNTSVVRNNIAGIS